MRRNRKRRRQIRRRRAVAGAVVLGIVAAIVTALVSSGGDTVASGAPARGAGNPATAGNTVKARPSDLARLKLRAVITGRISPKSVASSGNGYVTAQNMMYRHTITVYDA